MAFTFFATIVSAVVCAFGVPVGLPGDLAVDAGRPIHVALDERLTIKRVGQPITGTLVEPLYVYDRVVVPAGTKVRGHLARLDAPSRSAHIKTMLAGDFSPHRHLVTTFDSFVFADGREIPIRALVTGAVANARRAVAADPSSKTRAGRLAAKVKERGAEAMADAKRKAKDAIAGVKQPGRMGRLRDAAVRRLPYHPQFISAGTVFAADLSTPLSLPGGSALTERAAVGTLPAPLSILTARLVTPMSSANSPRGTAITAILTEPIFSIDHRLILPEGTTMTGEVTFAKGARHFRHNGQLRFLFERLTIPAEASSKLLASLYSVQVSGNDHVVIDEEGGAAITNPKTRFIAPGLAILTLRGSLRHEGDADPGDVGDAGLASETRSGNPGAQSVGGFFGFGLIGAVAGRISRPLGVAFAAVGVARTVYANIIAKGKEVSFPANTPIQLQLAPGPAK
jgi:hypothetical protein